MHKDLAELMPNVLNQLGPDTMAQLKRFAEQYQASQAAQAGGAEGENKEADDEEVPELVEAAAPAEVRLRAWLLCLSSWRPDRSLATSSRSRRASSLRILCVSSLPSC